MKRIVGGLMVLILAWGMAQKFSVEAGAGLYGDLGGRVAVVAQDLVPGLPLGVRLGVGFAQSDAIDDGYNIGGGTFGQYKNANQLNEWGQNITLSLDALFQVPVNGLPAEVLPYAGLRYNFFSGGFTDPKNNLPTIGSVTYSSNQFGLGAGVRLALPFAPNLNLVADLGADYYFKACIRTETRDDNNQIVSSGSGTVCPADSGYSSVDDPVTQPLWVFKLLLGAAYRF